MSQKTLRLIIAIAIVIGLLAVFSTLSGGIDLGNPGNDDESLTVCAHAKHDKLGRCTECGEEVGHDYSVRSGDYTCEANGKHRTKYLCVFNCGSFEYIYEVCSLKNNKCEYCGYEPDLVASCEHENHSISGTCLECNYPIGHIYTETYQDLPGDSHMIYVGCANPNCVYTTYEEVGCTYVGGKCMYCNDVSCVHTEHNQDGICMYCGKQIGHNYTMTYEEITDNDAQHTVYKSCEECGNTYEGLGSHKYGDDYTCDLCGYTATLD